MIDKYCQIKDFFSDKNLAAEIEPIEVDVKKNYLVVYDTMTWYKIWNI